LYVLPVRLRKGTGKVYFLALAADYDGTLAHDGAVDPATVDALLLLKETSRRLLLVTGRELPDLERAFPHLRIFDRVVAENGALLFDPETRTERALGPAPPIPFVEELRRRGVGPMSVGRSIVATWEPHEATVLEVIRDLGLELQIVFNKGAVMVLPAGVTKATGLAAALEELGLSRHNVVGVGDAENDHAFMMACGSAAAVRNALPLLKAEANVLLEGDHGRGVAELVGLMLDDDTSIMRLARHAIPMGTDGAGTEVCVAPHEGNVLIAGQSGIGKSTLATAFTERLAERDFEFCVFDPEGDYDRLRDAVSVGDPETPPQVDEVLDLLDRVGTNVVVNTQNLTVEERPGFFAGLLPRLIALRASSGRPHWLLIDEAHHLVPAKRGDAVLVIPDTLSGVAFITVHPQSMAAAALHTVRTVIALGEESDRVIAGFCAAIDVAPPPSSPPGGDEVLVWTRDGASGPRAISPYRPAQARRRHTRKYAEGDFGEIGSFYFRGPEGALKLRAHNLKLFVQIAEGVDDGTWEYHRSAHDYSQWFRDVIHDADLADEARAVESDEQLDAHESRARIAAAVAARYTAPAGTRDA
jgi:hypothetical protein